MSSTPVQRSQCCMEVTVCCRPCICCYRLHQAVGGGVGQPHQQQEHARPHPTTPSTGGEPARVPCPRIAGGRMLWGPWAPKRPLPSFPTLFRARAQVGWTRALRLDLSEAALVSPLRVRQRCRRAVAAGGRPRLSGEPLANARTWQRMMSAAMLQGVSRRNPADPSGKYKPSRRTHPVIVKLL